MGKLMKSVAVVTMGLMLVFGAVGCTSSGVNGGDNKEKYYFHENYVP